MNRFTRRLLPVIAGLGLGWYVAGVTPGLEVTLAQYEPQDTHSLSGDHGHDQDTHDRHNGDSDYAEAPRDTGHDMAGHGERITDGDSHGGGHDAPHEVVSAKLLVPQSGQVPWYRMVIGLAVGLFVAAVVLGVPALKLRGPEPPDPAAAPHSGDSHGH